MTMNTENHPRTCKEFSEAKRLVCDPNVAWHVYENDTETALLQRIRSSSIDRQKIAATNKELLDQQASHKNEGIAARFVPRYELYPDSKGDWESQKGIIFRDYLPLVAIEDHNAIRRHPNLENLTRITNEEFELHESRADLSERLNHATGNDRLSLEGQLDQLEDKLNCLQKFSEFISLLLYLCDAMEWIHKQGKFHLELNMMSVGVNRKGKVKILPSPNYDSQETIRRRFWIDDLNGEDIVSPEIRENGPITIHSDLYCSVHTAIRFLGMRHGRKLNSQLNISCEPFLDEVTGWNEGQNPLRGAVELIAQCSRDEDRVRFDSVQRFQKELCNRLVDPARKKITQDGKPILVSTQRAQVNYKPWIILGMSLILVVMLYLQANLANKDSEVLPVVSSDETNPVLDVSHTEEDAVFDESLEQQIKEIVEPTSRPGLPMVTEEAKENHDTVQGTDLNSTELKTELENEVPVLLLDMKKSSRARVSKTKTKKESAKNTSKSSKAAVPVENSQPQGTQFGSSKKGVRVEADADQKVANKIKGGYPDTRRKKLSVQPAVTNKDLARFTPSFELEAEDDWAPKRLGKNEYASYYLIVNNDLADALSLDDAQKSQSKVESAYRKAMLYNHDDSRLDLICALICERNGQLRHAEKLFEKAYQRCRQCDPDSENTNLQKLTAQFRIRQLIKNSDGNNADNKRRKSQALKEVVEYFLTFRNQSKRDEQLLRFVAYVVYCIKLDPENNSLRTECDITLHKVESSLHLDSLKEVWNEQLRFHQFWCTPASEVKKRNLDLRELEWGEGEMAADSDELESNEKVEVSKPGSTGFASLRKDTNSYDEIDDEFLFGEATHKPKSRHAAADRLTRRKLYPALFELNYHFEYESILKSYEVPQ